MPNTILSHLETYLARYPEEKDLLAPLVAMIGAGRHVTSRKHFPSHITAGALLLDEDHRYLAIHHKRLQKWLLPGGHLEAQDSDPSQSALRELIEETGLDRDFVKADPRWSGTPIDIDHHPIPENPRKGEPAHAHWDFLYVFTTRSGFGELTLNRREITAAEWRPGADLSLKLRSRLSALSLA